MNAGTLLYPRLSRSWLPAMIGYAIIGSLFAGAYGILHDQITYSISPEYFTRFKFGQFHYADFGLPQRVFVGEIGFLATWWVGFVAGWFLARVAVPKFAPHQAVRCLIQSFLIIVTVALVGATVGYLVGLQRRSNPDFSTWQGLGISHGIQDLPAFVHVAYIHNAGYVGALVGLIAAIWRLKRMKEKAEQLVKTTA
jgi:uncharacterized membrane protein SpoIIM required for sporulation